MTDSNHLQALRQAGLALAQTLVHVRRATRVGMTTDELNDIAHTFITKHHNMRPAFKGYRGFPKSICTSINTEIAHGIPSADRVLQDGDLLNIDIGIEHKGAFVDAGMSYGVGTIKPEHRRFLVSLQQTLFNVTENVIRGNITVGDIGSAVQNDIEAAGHTVVWDLTGHGVGKSIHEPPHIPNYGHSGKGALLPIGATIAVEPIATIRGTGNISIDQRDGWTISSTDGQLAGQFEFTLRLTEEGCEVLTPWHDFLTADELAHRPNSMISSTPRVYMLHGYTDNRDSVFWPQLKQYCENLGLTVIQLQAPDSHSGDYESWAQAFNDVPMPRPQDICVGHSRGGALLRKYLTENQIPVRCLITIGTPGSHDNSPHRAESSDWLASLSDRIPLMQQLFAESIHVYSDTDHHDVPDMERTYSSYGARLVMIPDQGHFVTTELPQSVLNLFRELFPRPAD